MGFPTNTTLILIAGGVSVLFMMATLFSYIRQGINKQTMVLFLITVYAGSLTNPVEFVPAFTLMLLGLWVGIACHEYSHYLLFRAWIDKKNLRMNILKAYVEVETPNEVPDWGIRIIAGIPYVLLVTLASAYYLIAGLPDRSLDSLRSMADMTIISIFIGLGSGVSPSDLLGILFPVEYKEFATNNEGKSTRVALTILKQSITRTLFN